MNLQKFIQENKEVIDATISRIMNLVPRTASCDCPRSGTEHYHESQPVTDKERRLWVLNDEGLYNWARRSGCRI